MHILLFEVTNDSGNFVGKSNINVVKSGGMHALKEYTNECQMKTGIRKTTDAYTKRKARTMTGNNSMYNFYPGITPQQNKTKADCECHTYTEGEDKTQVNVQILKA